MMDPGNYIRHIMIRQVLLITGLVRTELYYAHPVKIYNSVSIESLQEYGLLKTKNKCSQREQILSFKSSPYNKGGECILFWVLCLYCKYLS